MKFFNISRLNTEFGIFRVSGEWCCEKPDVENIAIQSVEIMGTDGWVLLDQLSNSNVQLMSHLLPLLVSHLLLKNRIM